MQVGSVLLVGFGVGGSQTPVDFAQDIALGPERV